jgi:hypothetical protein
VVDTPVHHCVYACYLFRKSVEIAGVLFETGRMLGDGSFCATETLQGRWFLGAVDRLQLAPPLVELPDSFGGDVATRDDVYQGLAGAEIAEHDRGEATRVPIVWRRRPPKHVRYRAVSVSVRRDGLPGRGRRRGGERLFGDVHGKRRSVGGHGSTNGREVDGAERIAAAHPLGGNPTGVYRFLQARRRPARKPRGGAQTLDFVITRRVHG